MFLWALFIIAKNQNGYNGIHYIRTISALTLSLLLSNKMEQRHIKHHRQISNALCQVKEYSLKRLLSVRSHLYDLLRKKNLQGQKIDQWLPEYSGKKREWTRQMGRRELFRVMKMFSILTVVVIRLYTFVKIQRSVHIKWVNFTICKYLNKPD